MPNLEAAVKESKGKERNRTTRTNGCRSDRQHMEIVNGPTLVQPRGQWTRENHVHDWGDGLARPRGSVRLEWVRSWSAAGLVG